MAIKRSPRYPRVDLSKAIDMIERLYEGAHQSKIDSDTAAKVIGYSNSSSGAAAGALGALRQYGLVDGLRGDVSVSDLAMRILQPMHKNEKIEALHEAANNPEVFSQVFRQFEGELPRSDAPIYAFLVRQLGYSQKGAAEVVVVLRATLDSLPNEIPSLADKSPEEGFASTENLQIEDSSVHIPNPGTIAIEGKNSSDEVIALPLGPDCRAEIRFTGRVTEKAYSLLIQHLGLLKESIEG